MLKVIAFDLFGTVFDVKDVPSQELESYADQIRLWRHGGASVKPTWWPLHLPASWENIPAFPDSAEGIALLRKKYMVVTCSNAPLGLTAKMSKNAGISWDAIIPLEHNLVYKPHPLAYGTVTEFLKCRPEEMMMVSANATFGDMEAAQRLNMWSQLIRNPNKPQTIVELAALLDRTCPQYLVDYAPAERQS